MDLASPPMSQIESILRDTSVSGVILNSEGIITEVSEGWRQSAEANGFKFPDHGLGINYLKYCISSDSQSLEIFRGLKSVLDKHVSYFSALYPCPTPQKQRWFVVAAFAGVGDASGTPVVHMDVSHLIRSSARFEQAMASVFGTQQRVLLDEVRRTVVEAVNANNVKSSHRDDSVNAADRKRLEKLTARQRQILVQLAAGATNAAIGAAVGLPAATVKGQVAAMLRKLGLANRTQAALFATRVGLGNFGPQNVSEQT